MCILFGRPGPITSSHHTHLKSLSIKTELLTITYQGVCDCCNYTHSSGKVGSIRVGLSQFGLTTRSQIEAPPGQAVLFGTVEEQFGQPMKQPSLNHKHMSPAQEPPLIHCSPAALVKLKMFTLPRLFRQGGMMRPPCAAAPEASARRAPKRRGNFIGEKNILNPRTLVLDSIIINYFRSTTT